VTPLSVRRRIAEPDTPLIIMARVHVRPPFDVMLR
jgi:hypothetical protein